MAQTIRYILFINRQYPPAKIVFIRADGVNLFTTDTPAIPPGEEPVESTVGRWSKVTIHHVSSLEDLIAEERRYYGDEVPVEVVKNYYI